MPARRGFAAAVLALLAWALMGSSARAGVLVDEDPEPLWPAVRAASFEAQGTTPFEAAAFFSAGGGITVNGPNHVLGRGEPPWWGYFSVRNPRAQVLDRLISLELTTQKDVRLYRRTADGDWNEVPRFGAEADGRLGSGYRHPVWAMHFDGEAAMDFLIRAEGPSLVRFPLYLKSIDSFFAGEGVLHSVLGLAVGVTLLVVFYSIFPGVTEKDATRPLVAGMLLGNLVGAMWLAGFGSEFFPSADPAQLDWIGFFGYSALIALGSLHARIYLGTRRWAPRYDRLLMISGTGLFVLSLSLPLAFPVAARKFMLLGGLVFVLLLVAISAHARIRAVAYSKYILVAWTVYLAFVLAMALPRAVELPVLSFSSFLVLIQTMVVALLFGLATRERLAAIAAWALVDAERLRIEKSYAARQLTERSRVFAALNHDLRQPLLGVGLYAHLLRSAQTRPDRESYGEKLGAALNEVDGLVQGIQQLAAALEPGHAVTLEEIALDEILRPIVEEYRHLAGPRHVAIRYQPTRVRVRTHAPYLQRMVRNLLSNAIRYSRAGDRVLVGYRRGAGGSIDIVDTGIGMTAEQLGKAFAPYQRMAAVPVADGVGLGLFSVRSLGDALGLTVAMDSVHDKGTRVRIGGLGAAAQEQPRSGDARAPELACQTAG